MKKIIFVMAIFTCFILLLGCVNGGDKDKSNASSDTGQQGILNQSNKTQSNMSEKDTIKTPMKPFYFKAQLNLSEESELFIAEYYFEKEMDCFGRKAYVGLNRFTSSDPLEEQESWRKITLYLDNYTMGVSGHIEKNSLVFDDAKEVKEDMNFVSLLNEFFLEAGQQMPETWTQGDIILLKNVRLGDSNNIFNISVVYTGKDNSAAIPCDIIETSLKQGDSGGALTLTLCNTILKDYDNFPVVVYLRPDHEHNIPSWEITDFEQKSSGVSYYSQCIPVVKCPIIANPTPEEENDCYAQGKTIIYNHDDKGCYTGFECIEQYGLLAFVYDAYGEAIQDMGVGVWQGDSSNGPTFAFDETDEDGVVIFYLEKGLYTVGLDQSYFPDQSMVPDPVFIDLSEDSTIEFGYVYQ